MVRPVAFSLFLSLSFSPAWGETAEQPTEAAPTIPDFSKGFERLVALGLPSLEGAEWIALDEQGHSQSDYYTREILSDIKGCAWRFQVNGKPVILPLGSLQVTDVPAESGGGRGILGALFGGKKKPTTIDVKADAVAILKALNDPQKSERLRSSLEYSGSTTLGTLLIFATQLHQAGHKEEANRLAATLFSMAAPNVAIDAAVSLLADRDYAVLTKQFEEKQDWMAYQKGLDELIQRYPRGWSSLGAIQMLKPLVAKRAAGTPPPTPKLEGITLNPKAVTAIGELVDFSSGRISDKQVEDYAKEHGIAPSQLTQQIREHLRAQLQQSDEQGESLWLLEKQEETPADPKAKLKALGMEAVPTLAAIVADDTLTLTPNAGSQRDVYYSSRSSLAEQTAAIFQKLQRPLTRGEIACRMLCEVLPGVDSSEATPESLAASAIDFWKQHRNSSQLQLAKTYLHDGDNSQQYSAADTLIRLNSPEAHQIFEQFVLEQEQPSSSLRQVTEYLKARKSAAKDFFTKYSDALKKELSDNSENNSNLGWQLQQAGGIDKLLKGLSVHIRNESPRTMLLEIVKADKPDITELESVMNTVAESSSEEFATLFLEAAATAKSLEARQTLLTQIYQSAYYSERGTKRIAIPLNDDTKKHWTTLLSDDRYSTDGIPIRGLATSAFAAFDPKIKFSAMIEIGQVAPVSFYQLFEEYTKAALEGRTLPELPDASKVSSERLEEMTKQISQSKPQDVRAVIRAWNLNEKIAFLRWKNDSPDKEKLPASLKEAGKFLTECQFNPNPELAKHAQQTLQEIGWKEGTQINPSQIENFISGNASKLKENSGLLIVLQGSPLGDGLIPNAARLFSQAGKQSPESTRQYLRLERNLFDNDESLRGVVLLQWISSSARSQGQALWRLHADGTIAPPDEQQKSDFHKILNTEDLSQSYFWLIFLHRDHLDQYFPKPSSEE